MNRNRIRTIALIPFVWIVFSTHAQDPLRFENEMEAIRQIVTEYEEDREVVVFTGSSSIRMWKNVQSYFPEVAVINTGFGGSHMSDLLYYLDDAVIRFNPEQVFIYEGDNDVASNIDPEEILATAETIVDKLKEALPGVQIAFISAKPSIARWNLKNAYEELNNQLEIFCRDQGLTYVNIWNGMLSHSGVPKQDIFLDDGLHMNKKGYNLWFQALKDYVK
jgi:lysophospholipase L1-like esterase